MEPEARLLARRLATAALVLWTAAAVVYGTFLFVYGDRPAYVHVRWAADVDDTARQRFEEQYQLTRGQLREGRTWGYFIADVSRANLRALVQNPQVEDTHQINRVRFTIWRTADRDPYEGAYAAWLPIVLQVSALFLLVIGAIPAGLAALEIVGVPASMRASIEPIAHAFSTPPVSLGPLAGLGRWLAKRIPGASAESVAAFRIVFGMAVVALVLLKPVGSDWITGGGGNPVTPLQDLVLGYVFARPAVADWLPVWIAVWGALFIAGAAARTSFVMLTLGVLVWGCVYTTRIGTHSISALMVTLPCLVWSRWGDAWSVDAWLRRRAPVPARAPQEYGYTMWMPGVVLGVALAAAAVSKVREQGLAWILNGTVKYHFLTDSRDALVDWGLWLGPHDNLAVLISFTAVAIEALVIVGALCRTYAYRAVAGLATLAMLIGFALFQGLFWPAWWILLLSFLPWHLIRGAGTMSAALSATPWTPLRVAQIATVFFVVVQQIAVSWAKAEVNPMLSAYDMYSTTYASPEDYEEKAGKTYWLLAHLENGSTQPCAVGRDDADRLAEAASEDERRAESRRLAEACAGPSAPVNSVTVEARGTAIDWERWTFDGEKRVTVAGPIQVR